MNTRKDNRKIINELRNEFIHQLKNSSWTGDEYSFYNEYFHIRYSEKWVVEFLKKVNGESYNRTLPVYFLLNKFHFFLLRKFYVIYSIRNNRKIKREEEIANFTKKFFDLNKSLKRDIKLKKLLNE